MIVIINYYIEEKKITNYLDKTTKKKSKITNQ